MTKKKVSDPLQHNTFQFLDKKWYLYTTPGNILTPTKSCNASGTNLASCTKGSPCHTSNNHPFYCESASKKGQSAMLVPKAGLDGVLCDPSEKTSATPYVVNVKQTGNTTTYECSNESTTSGTYRCDPNSGCIEDSTGTMTAKDCLEKCKRGYKCNDDYTCSSCLISESDPECIYGNCSNKRDFCLDCGKDSNCNGNGKCQEGNKCLCNPGYFGIHCEKKNCDTLPKGTCSWSNLSGLVNNCNKDIPEGCSITPKLVGHPFSPGQGSGLIEQDCECEINGSPRGTTLINSTACWCKLPETHPLRNPKDKGIGQLYWKDNAYHGGTHKDWNAICRQNYGPGAQAAKKGWWGDCGHECGHPWYTSTVPCIAPEGSEFNIPWAFYQNQ